ncbi:MAG: hypothetical protein ACOC2H_08785 [Spirochaetota bacterium]
MKKILYAAVILFFVPGLFAQGLEQAQGIKRYGMSSGIKLMNYTDYESEEDVTFYAAAIPVVEYLFPLLSNDLLLYTNTNLNWGLSQFFFDFGLGAGLRYYPLGNDIVSIYGGGEAGTFFFNNLTTTVRAGTDFDFRVNEDASVFMGGEILHRESYRVAEYIKSDHWYISSTGWGVNGGFRFRFELIKGGLKNMPKSM